MRIFTAIMICIIHGCWAAVAFCSEAAADVSMDALMNGVNQIIAVALPYLPESWGGWVSMAVTVGAVFAAVVPKPKEDANIVWRIVYAALNALGCNVARAKNASAASAAANVLKNLKK